MSSSSWWGCSLTLSSGAGCFADQVAMGGVKVKLGLEDTAPLANLTVALGIPCDGAAATALGLAAMMRTTCFGASHWAVSLAVLLSHAVLCHHMILTAPHAVRHTIPPRRTTYGAPHRTYSALHYMQCAIPRCRNAS